MIHLMNKQSDSHIKKVPSHSEWGTLKNEHILPYSKAPLICKPILWFAQTDRTPRVSTDVKFIKTVEKRNYH